MTPLELTMVPANEENGIEVPECTFVLEDNHFASLQQEVNPLQCCDNFGINLYLQTLDFVLY